MDRARSWIALACASIAALTAGCGGGGGGGDSGGGPNGPAAFVAGVAYLADAEVDEQFELYVADLEGTQVRKASPQLAAFDDVFAYAWSPDRTRLAFVTHGTSSVSGAVYVVDAAASAPAVVVSAPILPTQAFGESLVWSPDSQRVAYLLFSPGGAAELFTATPTGSSVRVSDTPAPGEAVVQFEWAPDSSRIAYRADQDAPDVFELYTNLPAGGDLEKASGPLVAGGDVSTFAWSPAGGVLAYVADQDVDEARQLFIATPDGSQRTQVSPAPGAAQIHWAPDGSRIAYLAFDAIAGSLHVVAPDGTGHTNLSDAAAGNVEVYEIVWAPDSSRVAYTGFTSPIMRLYTAAPTDGEGTLQASIGSLFSDSGIFDVGLAWSPSSDRLSYHLRALFVLEPGSFPMSVSQPTTPSVFVPAHAWAPDGSRIAYRENPHGSFEVFATFPDTAIGTVLLSPPLGIAAGTTEAPKWTPDSSHVVYRTDASALSIYELFAATADGASIARVSGALVRGGQVTSFAVR